MFAARVLFVVALTGIVGATLALVRPRHGKKPRLRPPWLPAVLASELVPLWVAVQATLLAILAAFGALDHRIGLTGVVLMALTWLANAVLQRRAASASRAVEDALASSGIPARAAPPPGWLRIAVGYPYHLPADISRREVEYMPGLSLDLYRNDDHSPQPAVLQIHGGGWRGGNRRQQARPLLHELAERGWAAAGVSYPLVPAATVEDQLIALKRAVGWMRTNGPEHGIDPDFIAVTGGSAGGHLASLLALTPNRPTYQPGFEHVETSVQAAVPFYGIYDLLNRNSTRDDWDVVRRLMREPKHEAMDRYRAASPLDLVGPHAPPFLVVHGDADSLIAPAEARHFVAALRRVSRAPVAHLEVPGANHAFDLFYSLRTHHVINGVARFLEAMKARAEAHESRHRDAADDGSPGADRR